MSDTYEALDVPEPESDLEYMLDPDKPIVLLLGWVDHEGILSSLKATGRQYKKKLLDSRPENWQSIVELFTEYTVSSVLGKLSGRILSLLEDPAYTTIRESLFQRISTVPNQVFIYDKLIQGEQIDSFHASMDPYPPQHQRDAALNFLYDKNVEIVPYRTRAEVTVLAESFLDELDRNLIFRLYVPSGKLWSAEADKFLQLFQDYLAKVVRLAVRLDQKRTDYGVIYEFHGEPPPGESSLTAEFQDFSRLMDLCATDADAAAAVLKSKNLDAREVTRTLEKYSKEVRRLQLDIKHDAESKIVSIRHRLESELIEYNLTQHDWAAIARIVNIVVPTFSVGLPAPTHAITGLPSVSQAGWANITYNHRPQFVNTMNGVIAEEVHGNQHFAPEHHQLLDLIRVHGGNQAKQLETAVYEIADKGVDQVDRLRAKQRIKGFLLAVGKKTGDMAFSLLQKYLETQIGI